MSESRQPSAECKAQLIELQVEAELTQQLFRSSGLSLVSNAVLAALMVLSVWEHFSKAHLLSWLIVLLLITSARSGLAFLFLRNRITLETHKRWRRGYFAGLIASASVWGLGTWYFLNVYELLPLCLVCFIIVGMNTGASRALTAVPAFFWCFAMITLLPIALHFALLPQPGHYYLAVVTLVYALFLANTVSLLHRDLRGLYKLIFENESLVETLGEEKMRAESALKAKNEFMTMMSHEIRTPMNAVLGMIQLLEDSPLSDEQKEHLSIAHHSADSLFLLLNDILEMAQIERGKLELDNTPFSPVAIADEVFSLLTPRAKAQRLDIRLLTAQGIPARVMGDPARLRQVLLNLVGNAIKFTPSGSVSLSITPEQIDENIASLRFSVKDTGIGMDSKTQAALFQSFSPGDSSSTRRYGGAGLGLAISQQLVRRMGGIIQVQSKPGLGSEFSFRIVFPLPHLHASAPPPSPNATSKGRVLVAENDWVYQRVIERMLNYIGLQAVIETNSINAIDMACSEKWDLFIFELTMPGVDGWEIARVVQKRLQGKPFPLIALSSESSEQERKSCFDTGIDELLLKPLKTSEFETLINRWLSASKRNSTQSELSASK
jgi:signal transduction histidine kinase/AmiR/NasT family two-component response regulator